ncbi:hypothetical protein [Sulfuricurvum sp.]|uniref:hypothetical protein n=1 Tax=Sulfuricurvum sp. TaxID=2025608 RepID=UPI003BAF84FB
MRLSEVASFGTGKVLIGIIIILSGALIALGFHDLSVSGERNVLEQKVKTAEVETERQKDRVSFMKAWMARDRVEAQEKEADYNRTMAAKPKYITSIKYVPIGEKCTDLSAIAEEARKNAEGGKL